MPGHLGYGETMGGASGNELRDLRDLGERLEGRSVVRAVDGLEEDLEEKGSENDCPIGSLADLLVGAEDVPEELPYRRTDGEDMGVDCAEPSDERGGLRGGKAEHGPSLRRVLEEQPVHPHALVVRDEVVPVAGLREEDVVRKERVRPALAFEHERPARAEAEFDRIVRMFGEGGPVRAVEPVAHGGDAGNAVPFGRNPNLFARDVRLGRQNFAQTFLHIAYCIKNIQNDYARIIYRSQFVPVGVLL